MGLAGEGAGLADNVVLKQFLERIILGGRGGEKESVEKAVVGGSLSGVVVAHSLSLCSAATGGRPLGQTPVS